MVLSGVEVRVIEFSWINKFRNMLNLCLFDSFTLMLEWVPIAMKIQTAIEFNT